jgi:peptide/nickel transport system substrate-binding protein
MAEALRGDFKAVVAIVLALVIAVPINILVGTAENAEAAPDETTLRIGFLEKIDSLNPYVGMNDVSHVFYGLVYDALMSVGNDLEVIPNLATSWYAVPLTDSEMVAHPSYPYGSVWQYNLTHDAWFTDGEPFSADDVVFNINLNAGNYTSIWAYQPYSYFMKDAVKVDDYTVRIHFTERVTGIPMAASYADMLSVPMLPKHLLMLMTPSDIGFSWNGTVPGDPPVVGTGPFMPTSDLMNEYLSGSPITLVRNPNCHWLADYGKDIHFDRLDFVFYDDVTAMSLALRNGQIDVAKFPCQGYTSLKDHIGSIGYENLTAFDGPSITGYWTDIGFCMNNAGPNPSRLDPAIRHAAAMATNKSYIVENLYLGLGQEGSTLISPMNSFWHYEPNASEKFDLNLSAANELLNVSGYPRPGGDPGGIRYCSASSAAVTDFGVAEGTLLTYRLLVRREIPEEKYIGQYLQNEWRKIGIDLQIVIVDEATLQAVVYSYVYDAVIWYWSSDIDPNYQLFAQSNRSWNGWSDNKYSSESYEENYTNSVTAMDPVMRQVYVDNCQRTNYLDAPYIILAYVNQTYVWRYDNFTGWGDWAANPGRSIDNCWTGNPLWFDLLPVNTPAIPEFSMLVVPLLGTVVLFVMAMALLNKRERS